MNNNFPFINSSLNPLNDNYDFLNFDPFNPNLDSEPFNINFNSNETIQENTNNLNDRQTNTGQNHDQETRTSSNPRSSNNRSLLIQWNPNGFYAHYEELALLVAESRPYIICVQETLLRQDQTLKFKGFTPFRKDVSIPIGNRVKGGVAILISDDCLAEQIPVTCDLQLVVIRVKYPITATLCCLYLPPGELIPDSELREIFSQLPTPLIVCSDVNARHELWGSDRNDARGKIIEDIFIDELGLMVMNDGSETHFSAAYDSFSAIDVTLCDPSLLLQLDWRINDDLCHSDHFPIFVELLETNCGTSPIRWKLNGVNWSTYATHVELELDSRDERVNSVDDFVKMIEEVASTLFRKSSGRVKGRQVPWWSDEIKQALRERKKKFKKFRRVRSPESKSEMRIKRSRARFLMKKGRQECWKNKLESINCNTPATEIWTFVRSMNGRKKRLPTIAIRSDDGELITGSKNLADAFAQKFECDFSTNAYDVTFQRIKSKAERIRLNPPPTSNDGLDEDFSLEELEKALNSCREGAPGPDGIPFSMLKNLPDSAKRKLLDLFNDSWRQRKFPSSWREAILFPVLKPGKQRDDINSYRPLSMTDCVFKVDEKMVCNRLSWYLERKDLLNERQFGFRGKRSTADVHVTLESEAQAAFAAKEHLVIVSFDMHKAYDRVWRRLILEVLIRFGIGGNMYAFFENFMSERKFKVTIGNEFSDWHVQENGLAQGSVSSVILFLLAIVDLPQNVRGLVEAIGFADDWYFYMRHKSVRRIRDDMQKSINHVSRWAKKSGFTFSETKTKAIHICRSRKVKRHTDPILKFNNTVIEMVPEMTILGLKFNKKLNWATQIEYTKQRARERLNILKAMANTKFGIDEKTLLQLHEAMVLSTIDYGSEAYDSASTSHLKKLDAVHHEGLRIATGAFRTSPSTSLYALTGKASLSDRRKKRVLSLGARILSSESHPLNEALNSDDEYPETSFVGRFRVLCRELELTECTNELMTNSKCRFPPWRVKIDIDLSLTHFPKEQTVPAVYKSAFQEAASHYYGYERIWTDGSKGHDYVGCSIVTNTTTKSWRLHDLSTVFTAELFALQKAVKFIRKSERLNFLICSDSLSSLLALRNGFGWSERINSVLEELTKCTRKGKNITFMWTPSHVGLSGNEAADEAAKETRSLSSEAKSLAVEDFAATALNRVKLNWASRWNESQDKLRLVKNNIVRWKSCDGMKRREQLVLNRLRIGHTKLTHSYIFDKTNPPTCEKCQERLNVEHILFGCENNHNQLSFSDMGDDRDGNLKVLDQMKIRNYYNDL